MNNGNGNDNEQLEKLNRIKDIEFHIECMKGELMCKLYQYIVQKVVKLLDFRDKIVLERIWMDYSVEINFRSYEYEYYNEKPTGGGHPFKFYKGMTYQTDTYDLEFNRFVTLFNRGNEISYKQIKQPYDFANIIEAIMELTDNGKLLELLKRQMNNDELNYKIHLHEQDLKKLTDIKSSIPTVKEIKYHKIKDYELSTEKYKQ